MNSNYAAWLASLTEQDVAAIAPTVVWDSPNRYVCVRAALQAEWRRRGCPTVSVQRPNVLPVRSTHPTTPVMRTSLKHSHVQQRDQFPHLRRYESLIESNPAQAGSYYQAHAGEILNELGLLRSEQALEHQAKAASRAPITAQDDENRAAWRHYSRLVDGGKSAEASRYYGSHAASIIAGKSSEDDDDGTPDPAPEGVCSVCSGTGYCPTCKGHGEDEARCACTVCGGTGKPKD